MPYLIVSALLKLETGPTYVGDENSDPELMTYLQGVKSREPSNNYFCFMTRYCIREVLDLLEKRGWKVVSSAGIDQRCIWTLHLDTPCSSESD